MPRVQPTLRVVANPYRVLDGDGDPACAVLRHDVKRLIGATLDRARSIFDDDKHVSIIKYAFTSAPEEIPNSADHRRKVQDRELLPADEATAKLCGVSFVPVARALASEQVMALAEYRSAHGEPLGAPQEASSPFAMPPARAGEESA